MPLIEYTTTEHCTCIIIINVSIVYECTLVEPLQMRSSDVDIQVSLTSGVSATIDFRVSICSI